MAVTQDPSLSIQLQNYIASGGEGFACVWEFVDCYPLPWRKVSTRSNYISACQHNIPTMSIRNQLFMNMIGQAKDNVANHKDCTKKLERLMLNESRIWWDQNTLQTYLDRKIVPRGLRLKKVPTFVYSEEFLIRWNDLLSDCSLKLIELIVQTEKMRLKEIEREILDMKVEIQQQLEQQPYEEILTSIQDKVNKYEKDIAQVKTKKLQRDSNDYDQGQVYNWRRREGPRSILKQRDNIKQVRFASHSTSGSSSDSFTSEKDFSRDRASKKYGAVPDTEGGDAIGRETRSRSRQ